MRIILVEPEPKDKLPKDARLLITYCEDNDINFKLVFVGEKPKYDVSKYEWECVEDIDLDNPDILHAYDVVNCFILDANNEHCVKELNRLQKEMCNCKPNGLGLLREAGDGTITFGAFVGERLVSVVVSHEFTVCPNPVFKNGLMLYISTVYTSPRYNGLGLATTLIEEAERRAKMIGVDCIRLDSDADRFYADNGYEKDNTTPMWKVLK